MLHLLRDLDAWLSSYGQCLRCHRSWQRAAPVAVWHSSTEATFLLCIDCWADVVGEADPHAGLILQGYARRHLDQQPRDPEVEADILAAYGVAWRTGVEWRPQYRQPLQFDVRPRPGERRRDQLTLVGVPWRPDDLYAQLGVDLGRPEGDRTAVLWPGAKGDHVTGKGPRHNHADLSPDALGQHIGTYGGHDHEAPGWDGAGSNVDGVDYEAPRG